MIVLVLFGCIVAYTIFTYLRNRQADRMNERRERLKEKEAELRALLNKQDTNELNNKEDER